MAATAITSTRTLSRKSNISLWVAQSLLTAIFLMAGVMKLITPTDVLTVQAQMPGDFIKFIGVCETLGALGLILPGLFRIRRDLTPLAAAGLAFIMGGAVTVTVLQHGIGPAIVPFVIGLLAVYVVRGRWAQTVRRGALAPTVLQPAR
jgi:putative oxidoreductase